MWTFWVVFTEMLLSIRLLHEGTLVPALRRIVAVLDEATPNIIALIFVLAPLTFLTSLMHSQLFGLFDDGFSDPFVSLTRIINMLTAPPPQANTEGQIFESQEGGAEVRTALPVLCPCTPPACSPTPPTECPSPRHLAAALLLVDLRHPALFRFLHCRHPRRRLQQSCLLGDCHPAHTQTRRVAAIRLSAGC